MVRDIYVKQNPLYVDTYTKNLFYVDILHKNKWPCQKYTSLAEPIYQYFQVLLITLQLRLQVYQERKSSLQYFCPR